MLFDERPTVVMTGLVRRGPEKKKEGQRSKERGSAGCDTRSMKNQGVGVGGGG